MLWIFCSRLVIAIRAFGLSLALSFVRSLHSTSLASSVSYHQGAEAAVFHPCACRYHRYRPHMAFLCTDLFLRY